MNLIDKNHLTKKILLLTGKEKIHLIVNINENNQTR